MNASSAATPSRRATEIELRRFARHGTPSRSSAAVKMARMSADSLLK
jgi:hypothetical protein